MPDTFTPTSEASVAKPERRRNVLFVTCDQWRGDCLSAYGHSTLRTPNIDALARSGVMFRRHYAGAAPCSPARACLYTGRYQMTNRVCRNGTPLAARFDNVATLARRCGYDPTLFGYTDVSPDPTTHHPADALLRSYEGVLPGFAVRQLMPEHQKPWLSWLAARGLNVSAGYPGIHRPAVDGTAEVSRAPPLYSRDETPTAFLAGEFIRWLGEQDAGAPWFAHVSFLSPHPPFVVPKPYNEMYDPAAGPAFGRAADWLAEARSHPWLDYQLARQRKDTFIVGAQGLVREWTDAEFRTIRSIYYGMISEVDDQLGRLWQALRQADAWDDTVIVLTSDHAEMMGDHYMLGKGGYFDQSYHVPLIVRDPDATGAAGTLVDRFTEAVDVLPTLLDLIGGQKPHWLDGRSLSPFLRGVAPSDWRDCAHWEFDFRSIADGGPETHFGCASTECSLAVLRSERFKYVHLGGGLPALLFDLQEDPHELIDRSNDPAFLRIRLELAERMLSWRSVHLDQALALVELTAKGAVVASVDDAKKPAPFPARAFL